jgi:hypothetical protein
MPALMRLRTFVSEIHLVDSVVVCPTRKPPEYDVSAKSEPKTVTNRALRVNWFALVKADIDGRSYVKLLLRVEYNLPRLRIRF